MLLRRFSLLLLSLLATTAGAETLRLSGEVAARSSQVFVAPRSDSWQMQIAWMVEEGQRIAAGDPVVQYDTTSLAANLEQLEADVRRVTAESRRSDLVQDLELRQAQHDYEVAVLLLERARLDAGIPRELLSDLRYEEYQLALKEAESAKLDAERALVVKEKDVEAEKRRNRVQIASAENELERVQSMLNGMTQRARRGGTAMYVDHPWNRQKIRSGDMVQRGFSVLEIPSTDDLHVRAWLNEVDVARLEENLPVSIHFDARPQLVLSGTITRIGSQAEPRHYWGESGYINVEIAMEGAEGQGLLPGMSVLVELEAEN
ncbi:HlyD family secretion protein [Marinimicrobium sp. ABcell2]|uniref:HlyD family secretion protein n=1 Tax=Marinimicrobium sp. ABcell2 TaxID=3069751 RepID=UPI0027B7D014|nr:HlyD family efflux transporter periplasmic adaptor subunit [Marinimicrobium sp. ABcell2]MDQ2076447.1 HlyD family efflux transporter periplasmic adaptor subunit [Marinimicrobium sp. ABcell2]